MHKRAQYLIDSFQLEPLVPEGGYFRRIFTHPESTRLPGFGSPQVLQSAIYFLITKESFSQLHRIPKFEHYAFLEGDPCEMLHLHADGSGLTFRLGLAGPDQQPCITIDPHVWQGTRLVEGGEYAFFHVVVSPGFEEEDFQFASRKALTANYPKHQEKILWLTPDN